MGLDGGKSATHQHRDPVGERLDVGEYVRCKDDDFAAFLESREKRRN